MRTSTLQNIRDLIAVLEQTEGADAPATTKPKWLRATMIAHSNSVKTFEIKQSKRERLAVWSFILERKIESFNDLTLAELRAIYKIFYQGHEVEAFWHLHEQILYHLKTEEGEVLW